MHASMISLCASGSASGEMRTAISSIVCPIKLCMSSTVSVPLPRLSFNTSFQESVTTRALSQSVPSTSKR